jgi:hypothetical protein
MIAHSLASVRPLLLPATFLAAACGGMPERIDPRPLVGCHYFVQDDVARDLQLPWGVRLLDQPLQGWPALQQRPDIRRATTLTGHDEVDFPFGYWLVTASDSLEIGYPAGGGLLLELAITNGAFQGHARPVGDAVPIPGTITTPQPHPVRMVWARCPEDA